MQVLQVLQVQPWQAIIAIIAALIVGAIVGWAFIQTRRRHLRSHFGPEYDRTIDEMGNRQRAEAELARREARVRKLKIRPLTGSERQSYLAEWNQCQSQFVNDPVRAVDDAERLLDQIMRARGYSFEDPKDRLANISAAYPNHTSEYRDACELIARHRRGEASTEELRQALVHYRALFVEILGGYDEELKRAS